MGTDINIKKKIGVQEESVTITPDVNSINFTGAGVTASSTGDNVTVNIPGTDTNIYNSDGTLLGNRTVTMAGNTLNFTGGNVGLNTSPTQRLDVNGVTRHRGNVIMDPGTTLFWLDDTGVLPTSVNSKIRWRLNNDAAEIYAFQTNADDIDFVFKIADNATVAGDNYVFWIDDDSGEAFDRYPLEMNGLDFIVNPLRRYATLPANQAAGATNFNVLKLGATNLTGTILHANVTTGRVGINTSSPSETLDVNGKTKTTTFQMTTSPVAGYILTSDASGNGSWQPAAGTGTVTSIATSSPITGGTITGSGTIGIQDAIADGATKGAASFTASDFNSASGVISLDYLNGQKASALQDGFLSSTDWSTFNGKQNAITLTTTGTSGAATLVGSTLNIPNYATASGRFGISDSNGVYTYYTTLSLAMAAATAGQTIEMFADVTESGAVTVTLKNNVTINGNGHRYTHTSTTGNTFNFVFGATVYINNLIIDRTVTTPTGAAVFYVDNSFGSPMRLRCSSVYVNYTFTSSVGATPIITADALTQYIVEGLNATANGSGAMFSQSGQPITVINCFARNTATGNGYSLSALSTIDDSYASVVSGTGISLVAGSSARNCNSIATTGVGIAGAGSAYQCNAFSNTNYAYSGVTAYNCTGQTTSGTAFYSCIIRNCSGTATTGAALAAFFSPAYAYNSSLQSTGGVTIPSSPWSMLLENCSITNEWNNASGHAVTFGSSGSSITNDITNCKITVSNASANCLNVASAINAKYSNNVFKGATTPVNANITQTIVNTQDNQGNILM